MFLIQDKKKESKKFVADHRLFLMGITCWFSEVCLGLFTAIIGKDSKIVVMYCVIGILMCTGVSLFALPKWFIIIEFFDDRIIYKPAFKKTIEKKYSDFGYFYCATYTYFTTQKYIVFSQRRLNDYELTHINNVAVSDNLIKIKVRKGLKEDLSSFLLPKFLFRIPKDFW